MEKINEIELQLVEKSFKIIDFVLGDLKLDRIDQAISMYNSLLQAFESIQKMCEKQYNKSALINQLIVDIEQTHKLVIQKFEKNELENIIDVINSDVVSKYQNIQAFFKEKKYYDEYNINVVNQLFKKFKDNGYLDNIDNNYIESVQDYYLNHLGAKVDPSLHIAYRKITGLSSLQVVPQHIMWNEVIPFLNNKNMMYAYSDKNIYNILITSDNTPEVILKRVTNQYYDSENNSITRGKAFKILFDTKNDIIVKHSLSDDGKAIEKLRYNRHAHYLNEKKMNLKEIEDTWGENFIIQKVIKQHSIMAAPHKSSVNTLRMVTLRWNNEIHYLTTFARFGANNSVKDNGSYGGLAVGVSETGIFNTFAIDKNAKIYTEHPTTGFQFDNLEPIPNFERFISFVKTLHKRILHHNFVSWDISVDENGNPIFIEMNFWGAVWMYQLATQRPILGDFTEEILNAISKERHNNENRIRQ